MYLRATSVYGYRLIYYKLVIFFIYYRCSAVESSKEADTRSPVFVSKVLSLSCNVRGVLKTVTDPTFSCKSVHFLLTILRFARADAMFSVDS